MQSFCDLCFATYLLLHLCCVCRSNLPGRCRFMGDKKITSSSSPSSLDSHFPFMTSTAPIFPELCWRLFLSPCASFQRQTEREKFGHSEILGLVPTASSAPLCTPSMWRGHRDTFLFRLTSGRHLLQLSVLLICTTP